VHQERRCWADPAPCPCLQDNQPCRQLPTFAIPVVPGTAWYCLVQHHLRFLQVIACSDCWQHRSQTVQKPAHRVQGTDSDCSQSTYEPRHMSGRAPDGKMPTTTTSMFWHRVYATIKRWWRLHIDILICSWHIQWRKVKV